ncbi:MAG: phosphotransferase family protein [Gammaproteobacteria bacterium]
MDRERLERYLRDRLGGPVSIVSLSRFAMGLSRQTWFVRLSDREIVVRCNLPGGASSVPQTQEFEYEMYRRLADTSVPVPRALWDEAEPAGIGQPFYVREMIDGTPDVPHFEDPDPRYDDVRIEVAREHARRLAAVHALDWRALGLDSIMPAPASAAASGVAAIDRIQATIDGVGIEAQPLIAEICDRLRASAPPGPARVMLCKGSNGAMQEVWRDGRIVAMCDWELASLGDPASDWARCQGYVVEIPGRWTARDQLEYYREISGNAISDRSLAWYRQVYALEMIGVGMHSVRPIVDGSLLDARLALLSTAPIATFVRRLATELGIVR